MKCVSFFHTHFTLDQWTLVDRLYTKLQNIYPEEIVTFFSEMFREIESYLENEKWKYDNEDTPGVNLEEAYSFMELEIDKPLDSNTLHKQYRKMSLKYHPDKHQGDGKLEYEDLFKKLGECYKFIKMKKFE